jgi:hypothetical protein
MTKKNIDITPATIVNDLLDSYPELEDTLISIAPPFKKLKNPFLRKTIAKVATIKHISSVGSIPLNDLINQLRNAVGQSAADSSFEDENYFSTKPEWFSNDKISLSIEEDKLDDKDKMTLTVILHEAGNIRKGNIIELITTFLPAPGIDILKSKGYSVWTKKEENGLVKSYFLKNKD